MDARRGGTRDSGVEVIGEHRGGRQKGLASPAARRRGHDSRPLSGGHAVGRRERKPGRVRAGALSPATTDPLAACNRPTATPPGEPSVYAGIVQRNPDLRLDLPHPPDRTFLLFQFLENRPVFRPRRRDNSGPGHARGGARDRCAMVWPWPQ